MLKPSEGEGTAIPRVRVFHRPHRFGCYVRLGPPSQPTPMPSVGETICSPGRLPSSHISDTRQRRTGIPWAASLKLPHPATAHNAAFKKRFRVPKKKIDSQFVLRRFFEKRIAVPSDRKQVALCGGAGGTLLARNPVGSWVLSRLVGRGANSGSPSQRNSV